MLFIHLPKVLTSCIDESNYGFRSYEVVQDRMKMVYRLTKKTVNIKPNTQIWFKVNQYVPSIWIYYAGHITIWFFLLSPFHGLHCATLGQATLG